MSGEPLTNELIYKLTDEQRAILSELADIAARELNLRQEIEEVTQQVKESREVIGFEQKKDQPEILAEDPEVDVLITSKPRYKIENVRDQICRILNRAIDLGLGNLAIIQRQCKNYGCSLEPSKIQKNKTS